MRTLDTVVLTVVAAVFTTVALTPDTVEAQAGGGTPCCDGIDQGGDTDDSNGSPTVTSWVVGATGGGVSPPSGASSCTGWQPGSLNSGGEVIQQGGTQSEYEVNGQVWRYWYRDCGGVIQNVWAPDYSPEDLARIALLEVERNLPAPFPLTSPLASVGGFVSLETWLQVGEEVDVSATAGPLPNGLTATTTAQPARIEWTPIAGDEPITCELWGSLPTENEVDDEVEAPCGWLPPGPSAPQYGGGEDLMFHGTVELVWSVAWTATNGAGDDLGELTSDVDWSYQVREIQTIGEDR